MTIRLTELNSEPEWDPDRASVNRSRASTIVRYCQNTIDYSSCSLTSRVRSCKLIASRARNFLFFFASDLWPLTSSHAYSTLTSLQRKRYLFVCINRRAEDNPKGCCAAKDSEEVYRALKGEVAARGLAKLEARVCTSSCLDQMRHRRDDFSRTESFFLWPRHGRGRPGDCGCPRYASTC